MDCCQCQCCIVIGPTQAQQQERVQREAAAWITRFLAGVPEVDWAPIIAAIGQKRDPEA